MQLVIFGLASAPSSLAARSLSTKPMVLLGEASYALYLCHEHALRLLTPTQLPPNAWLLSKGGAILMVIALAVGLHVTIERPSRAVLRRLLDPLAKRQADRIVLAPASLTQLP